MELLKGWILKMQNGELRIEEFNRNGFAIIRDFCEPESLEELANTFKSLRPERNVLSYPSVRNFVV
jgi:hypothetical protein